MYFSERFYPTNINIKRLERVALKSEHIRHILNKRILFLGAISSLLSGGILVLRKSNSQFYCFEKYFNCFSRRNKGTNFKSEKL